MTSLLDTATTLHHRYSSQRAYERAREGAVASEGAFAIPEGMHWQPPLQHASSAALPKATPLAATNQNKRQRGEQEKVVAPAEPFTGDQALAGWIMLMHESILSRELAQAVAEGDPGRVYEAVKVSFCM